MDLFVFLFSQCCWPFFDKLVILNVLFVFLLLNFHPVRTTVWPQFVSNCIFWSYTRYLVWFNDCIPVEYSNFLIHVHLYSELSFIMFIFAFQHCKNKVLLFFLNIFKEFEFQTLEIKSCHLQGGLHKSRTFTHKALSHVGPSHSIYF